MSNITTLLRRPFILGHELRNGIEGFAHTLCSSLGLPSITIQWSEGISTAGITHKGSMVLAAVADDARINHAALVRYVGFVVHELLHRKSTDFPVLNRVTGDAYQYRRALLNAVEDARIEREAIASGLLGNIEGVMHDLLGQMVSEALAQVQDWGNPAQYPFALAVTLRDYPGLSVPMPAQVQRIATVALARMPAVTTTDEARELAEWIYTQLQQMDEDEQQDDQGDQGDDQQGDEQGDEQGDQQGDQGDDSEGDSEGEGQGDAGQGDQPGDQGSDQGAAGDDKPGKGQEQGESGAQGDEQGQDMGKPQTNKQKPLKAKRPDDCTPAREVEPTTGNRPENEGATGSYTKKAAVARDGLHTWGSAQPISTTVPARLRYELRRLFENTAQTLHLNNRKTGRLNPGALARHQVTDTVFRKRLDIEGIDSAVVICLDLSGSMYDYPERIKAALSATYALSDTLTAAGVNVAVVTFDRFASVAVPFGAPRRNLLDTIPRIHGGELYTNDWYALRLAHDLLHRRHEARKVVFFVSDGCGLMDEMKAQVKAGEALGITTLGVGIQLNVSHIYGPQNSVTVMKPDDLGTAAFSRMKLAA